MNGTEFPIYKRNYRQRRARAGKVVVFIAYEQDGQAISTDIGPLRMCIMAPGQLTDGSGG